MFDADAGIDVPPEKRRLSMIFQSYALWPHMTAFQNVAYPLQNRRLKKTEIAERVGARLRARRDPGAAARSTRAQMSGGQQQRVALARALAGDADLILFDEPLSNVDAKVREQLRVELLSMQRELGFAAIYVTHDQAEAMELATASPSCARGGSRSSGPPQEIYLEPASRYVADFVGSSNELFGTLRSVDGGVAVVETDLGAVSGVAGATASPPATASSSICRPERTRPRREEPQSPNRWRAEVRAAAFLGANLEHVVRVGEHTFRLWSVDTRLLDAGDRGVAVRRAGARPGAAGWSEVSDFDPLAPETFDSFHAEFAELRERCPVARSDAYNGFWALTRYDDVVAAAARPGHFTTTVQNVVPKLAFTGRRPPLHLDPPDHTPYRAALNPYFTQEKMAQLEPSAARDHRRPPSAARATPAAARHLRGVHLPAARLRVRRVLQPARPSSASAIRAASREFNLAVQDFVEEDVKRTSMQLYEIARDDHRDAQGGAARSRRRPGERPARGPGCRRTCCSGRSGSSSSSG